MSDPMCNFFWGSHGCHKPMGDHTLHQCGFDEDKSTCSQYDEQSQRIRYADWDSDESSYEWSGWSAAHQGWRQ